MSIRPLIGEGRIRAQEDVAQVLQTASWLSSSVVFDNRRWVCKETELRWTAPHHLIVLTEEGRTSQTCIQVDGRRVYDGRDRPGAVTFVPAGTERLGIYRDADLTYSALWIDPELRLLGCDRLRDLPILVNKSDAVIGALLSSLGADMSLGHKPEAVYVEHLVALIVLRLAALNRGMHPAAGHGSLGRRTLARIRDYIDANTASEISLTDLAAVAGMTADTFARRFKATTGHAPYAYVVEERVRQAETLLGETDMAIGAIAARVGFSSQSHFTTTFRRLRGMTPRTYRTRFFPES
jgi:AraC family transcriptional regulator